MKIRSTLLAIVLAGLALSGCSTAAPSPVPVTQNSQTAGHSSLVYDLTSKEFGFKVKFPSKPEETTQDLAQSGEPVAVTVFTSSSEKDYFALSTFNNTCAPEGEDIANRLKSSAAASIDGAAKNAGDNSPKIISQTSMTLSGKPAMETHFSVSSSGSTTSLATLSALDGSRFYSLVAVNSTLDVWHDFLTSFVITDHPPASGACAPLPTD